VISEFIRRNISNIPGWRTNRKIVVIESDDWGAIRMSSKDAFESLVSKGVPIATNHYCKFDCLESAEDLSMLFEVLQSVRDKHGRPATLTAVSVVANPDFDRIRNDQYQSYHYEPVTTTWSRYGHKGISELVRQGVDDRLFIPQFHGREHLNITSWLKSLRAGNLDTIEAFNFGVYGIRPRNAVSRINFQAAFDFDEETDLNIHKKAIEEGLDLFKTIYGCDARYFIPTNGPFSNSLEKTAAAHSIAFMGTSKIQLEPVGSGQTRRVFHRLGQQNAAGQLYLTRNAFFEPSASSKDWVSQCMKEIKTAFIWQKPAVISSHRVNYIGSLDPHNRARGLVELKSLLNNIIATWPDVEFLSSDQLGDLIKKTSIT
jgi:hypothetical protein